MSETSSHSSSATDQLITTISAMVQPLGYEVIHLEVDQRQKTLRLFIDYLAWTEGGSPGVGIEDCVKVTKALDEPLDQMPEVDSLFGAAGYELEVSSPGIDRPLRGERDFERFKGREIRVHTFRPLTGDELGNGEYQAKNPKQKNFLGTLQGVREGKVLIALNLTGGFDKTQKAKKAAKKAAAEKPSTEGEQPSKRPTNSAEVEIPLPLISKANLEADFSPLEGAGE